MEKRPVSRKKEPPRDPDPAGADPGFRRLDTYRRLERFDDGYYSSGRGGFRYIAGVDEAGRGALAGPVVSAAVILPRNPDLLGVDDSKKLTEKTREELFSRIISTATAVRIAVGQPSLIDRENILRATLLTMSRAVSRIKPRPDLVLVDGNATFWWEGPVIAVKQGDGRSLSIAAASIVAKVARDRLMRKLHNRFPEYNFTKNKGYGTREHLEAILTHGAASVHRTSFHPKVVEKNLSLF